MESPGKFLRRERETRSISLEEISNFTKIKAHHLKAIEEDRYEVLPPALYVKGFLTGYARCLALDPRDIVLQYEKYLKSLIPPEPVELQPVAPPKKKVRQRLLLFLVFVVILSTTFFFLYPPRRPAEKKSEGTSLSLISPSLATQSEAKARPIYQAQQNQFSESERAEADVTK
jgi:cytoskeletal protein RodZ